MGGGDMRVGSAEHISSPSLLCKRPSRSEIIDSKKIFFFKVLNHACIVRTGSDVMVAVAYPGLG